MSTQEPSTPATAKRMTRKAALKELFLLHREWYHLLSSEQFEAAFAQRERVSEALRVLTRAVLGPHDPCAEFSLPCECCYEHYTRHFVHEPGKVVSTWCCTPCRDRLRAEGKLVAASKEAAREVS
jgi:hypothetical protein